MCLLKKLIKIHTFLYIFFDIKRQKEVNNFIGGKLTSIQSKFNPDKPNITK